ncbi:GroES-like superfamily [Sesbania bispinosa]|nr:GroES-like superfamily [Sesbania bispinosa]
MATITEHEVEHPKKASDGQQEILLVFSPLSISPEGKRCEKDVAFKVLYLWDEHFVVGIPDSIPLDAAAPLLCAGITYITQQTKEAIQHLGADSFLISRDQNQMQAAMGTLDELLTQFR